MAARHAARRDAAVAALLMMADADATLDYVTRGAPRRYDAMRQRALMLRHAAYICIRPPRHTRQRYDMPIRRATLPR